MYHGPPKCGRTGCWNNQYQLTHMIGFITHGIECIFMYMSPFKNTRVAEGLKMVRNRKMHEITNQRKQRNTLQSIRNNNQISSLADL